MALAGLGCVVAIVAAARHSMRPPCTGYIDYAGIAGGDPVLEGSPDPELLQARLRDAAAATPVVHLPVRLDDPSLWALGPFTLHAPGAAGSMSLELTHSCDGHTVDLGGHPSGASFQARVDPQKSPWYIVTVDRSGALDFVLPLHVVALPQPTHVPPSPLVVLASLAALSMIAFALRGRRHALRSRWLEVAVNEAGVAVFPGGVRVHLDPPPPPSTTVLCAAPPTSGAIGYRDAHVVHAAAWVASSVADERRRLRRATISVVAALLVSLGCSFLELTAR